MRNFLIPELFFKKIAEQGKLYSRLWIYWLGNYVDQIFEDDFLEKQGDIKGLSKCEIKKIYELGIQHLQQDFKIIDNNINDEHLDLGRKIIFYLNEKSKKNFKVNKSNLRLIIARLKEGNTYEDFKYVIDKKCYDWAGTNMEEYLRPQTLFSNKFESYLNSKNESTTGKTTFDKFALAIAQAKSISFRRDE